MAFLPTLSVTIDETGISAPSLAVILNQLQARYRSIYGSDVYLGDDSQDGQWLSILASIINDNNNACIATYNAYSPTTAQGNGLSSNVKINGLKRELGNNSQATVTISGVGGTIINNGVVGDNQNLGTTWALPAHVVIPAGFGSVFALATCLQDGPISAAANTLKKILTPTGGWTGVTNAAVAVVGFSTEDDATLRIRQSTSTSLPAIGPAAGALASIKNLPGVKGRSTYYENVSGVTDGNGLPPSSIAFVIEGGDPTAIATELALKKFPGSQTYGTTSVIIPDQAGVGNTISFFVLSAKNLDIVVNVKGLTGYVSTTTPLIEAAVLQFVKNMLIGQDSYIGSLYAPARLSGDAAIAGVNSYLESLGSPDLTQLQMDALANTYNLQSILQCVHGGTPAPNDITVAFNAAALTNNAQITVNVS